MPEPTPTCNHGEAGKDRHLSPSLATLTRASGLFRALGDAPRLRILEMLTRGALCVSEIVQATGEKFPTVSQRLRVLRSEGLVVRSRKGTHLIYDLADRHVAELIQNALAHAVELEVTPPAAADEGDA